MIFPEYKEACEALLDYPKIGGESIKEFAKDTIRNLFHTYIDIRIRRLVAEFPGDGVKSIAKIQSHCTNMNVSDKSRYDRIFQQFTHKGGESTMNCIIRLKMHRIFQFR